MLRLECSETSGVRERKRTTLNVTLNEILPIDIITSLAMYFRGSSFTFYFFMANLSRRFFFI